MTTPPAHRCFAFLDVSVSGREITLRYALRGGPDPEIRFAERLQLPSALPPPDPRQPRIRALLDLLHRTFGVSYYKVCCPPEIEAPPASAVLADYCELLYGPGMGEFYYRNRIDFRDRLHFPRVAQEDMARADTAPPSVAGGVAHGPAAAERSAGERVMVLVGGGKDSVVAREVMRRAGVAATAFSLGNAPFIASSAAAMELPHLVVERRLDPVLFELNTSGALNGHVPISACIATVAVLCAELGGYDAVITANERSADQGNLLWHGQTINHQWSKSSDFERALGVVLAALMEQPPRYFSLLRPLSELHISKLFLRHERYWDVVTSCNKNFRVVCQGPTERWCGTCPKCVFVNLMMAPHGEPEMMLRIFGRDLLHLSENRQLLRELLGLSGLKPFECVGTFAESRAALLQLAEQGRLSQELQLLSAEVRLLEEHPEELFATEMTPLPSLGSPWQERLDAYLAAD